MKKQIQLLIVILVLASLSVTPKANAQAPQKMSYQSVVRNSANALVTNQAVGVRISIIEGAIEGVSVYSEVHTVTTNTNGLFTLEVGGGNNPIGTFSAINWSNGSHFIKSEIDPIGGINYTISATKELLSVPYALNGITAAQANAITAQAATIATMQAQIASLQAMLFTFDPNGEVLIDPCGGGTGCKPMLGTTTVLNTTNTTATIGGMISDNGGVPILSKGVCWNSSGFGYNYLMSTCTASTDSEVMGSFSSSIVGLNANTTYYVRAYATNSNGTSYGSVVTFTTAAGDLPPDMGGIGSGGLDASPGAGSTSGAGSSSGPTTGP